MWQQRNSATAREGWLMGLALKAFGKRLK